MTTHPPTESHGTGAMGDGDTVQGDAAQSVSTRTAGALVSAMTPAQVEAVAVACMAALERRPGRTRTGPLGEFADLGLRSEALEYARKRDIAATDWMVGLGIPRDLTGVEMLGVTRAETGNRKWTPPTPGAKTIITRPLWAPKPDGRPIITLPIWSGECCIDILALSPEDANEWSCLTDIVPVLDPNEIARCEFLDEPLHVHASPLSWLRAGAIGTVVLDWRSALFYLSGVRRFICHDQATAKRLEQALRYPPPRFEIKLAQEACNAAA